MKNHFIGQIIFIGIICISPLLSSCQASPVKVKVGSTPSATPVLGSNTNPEPTLAPTEVLESLPNSEDPLRINFPTPGPEPVSLWRAPLYPVPWALSAYDHFYFSRPIAANVVNWPEPDYRYGGTFFSTDIIHTGIDIPNPKGTPVIAAGPGKVIWAGYGLYRGTNDTKDPYGLAVTIRHSFGYKGMQLYTIYAHLDRIDVIPGQWVDTGTPLGIVGSTGATTGPHLHFEVRLESNTYFTTRNPELWLAPPQGSGVLVGRMMNTNGSLLTREKVVVRSLKTNQKWTVITYGKDTVVSDDNYHENLVLSDLPAGDYELSIAYQNDDPLLTKISINPGAITYITFRGKRGFNLSPMPTPGPGNWLKFTNP